jgi:hypothetical protein
MKALVLALALAGQVDAGPAPAAVAHPDAVLGDAGGRKRAIVAGDECAVAGDAGKVFQLGADRYVCVAAAAGMSWRSTPAPSTLPALNLDLLLGALLGLSPLVALGLVSLFRSFAASERKKYRDTPDTADDEAGEAHARSWESAADVIEQLEGTLRALGGHPHIESEKGSAVADFSSKPGTASFLIEKALVATQNLAAQAQSEQGHPSVTAAAPRARGPVR